MEIRAKCFIPPDFGWQTFKVEKVEGRRGEGGGRIMKFEPRAHDNIMMSLTETSGI